MSHALKLCKASSSSFRRRLMPKTLRLTAGAMLEQVGDVAATYYYEKNNDIYDWMVRIHIKCMKTWAFIQLQVPKIGFRNALECFAYVHLGSIVRRSRSPSSPIIKVAAVTGGQECGKICLEPGDRFQLPSCQASLSLKICKNRGWIVGSWRVSSHRLVG